MTLWHTGNPKGNRCPFQCGKATTHVVKWPHGAVFDEAGNAILMRTYVCASHAKSIVRHQNKYQNPPGTKVKAYRYRYLFGL